MLRRKIPYFILAGILLIVLLFALLSSGRHGEVIRGYTKPIVPKELTQIVGESHARITPTILRNNEVVSFSGDSPFLTTENDVMLPIKLAEKAFSMVLAQVSGDRVVIIRGENRIEVNVDTDEVTINGETAVIGGALLRMKNTVYVSADFLAKKLGIPMTLDPLSGILSVKVEEDYLPAVFSLAEVERMPEAFDQGETGGCWAYAALSALESSIMPEEKYIFSRTHLLRENRFGLDLSKGGASGMAVAYLLSWRGPILRGTEGAAEEHLPVVKHVQDVLMYEAPDLLTLKKAVFSYGAVETSLYLCTADEENLQDAALYWNGEKNAYCYNGARSVNHDVVLVGWDDSFPKENFVQSESLPGDGAFLCMNSWGRSFGQNGLFYVSYYDTCFARTATAYTRVENITNYSGIYQSDLCGQTASAGYGNENAYFANVFTAEKTAYVKACGFYTLGERTSYEVYFTDQAENAEDLKDAVLITQGEISGRGYHTIDFPEGKPVFPGNRFAVVVKIRTEGVRFPVAVEKVTESAPDVVISDGEGYLSNNGKIFKNTEKDSACNVCLKVYTGTAK